ncbi:hypothetical protein AA310_04815 [Arthrobacter sp. YC-RL1]|nr:hypothetical protein ATC04_14105 [Arthrobacter sp. YC-RL1]KLI89951.1 hypothetical protein AA310_04815 [Arthrobacter sp. YC-RL1]
MVACQLDEFRAAAFSFGDSPPDHPGSQAFAAQLIGDPHFLKLEPACAAPGKPRKDCELHGANHAALRILDDHEQMRRIRIYGIERCQMSVTGACLAFRFAFAKLIILHQFENGIDILDPGAPKRVLLPVDFHDVHVHGTHSATDDETTMLHTLLSDYDKALYLLAGPRPEAD